jgi:hypothetical protein
MPVCLMIEGFVTELAKGSEIVDGKKSFIIHEY